MDRVRAQLIATRFLILVLLIGPPMHTAESQESVSPAAPLLFELTPDSIKSIKPDFGISEEQFERRWGQFELRVAKEKFPIAAPNCRSSIILRVPGSDPKTGVISGELRVRWDTFLAVSRVAREHRGEVVVSLRTKPYMSKLPDGQFVLEYCNAFVSGVVLEGNLHYLK